MAWPIIKQTIANTRNPVQCSEMLSDALGKVSCITVSISFFIFLSLPFRLSVTNVMENGRVVECGLR